MTNKSIQPRLRIFAGPNGSGKSTIIESVKNYKIAGIPVDFGIYVNADDIAEALRQDKFSFVKYQIKISNDEFYDMAIKSGLIGGRFSVEAFRTCYKIDKQKIVLLDTNYAEGLAQVISAFLHKSLMSKKKKFSFETVFSHDSKIELMKTALNAGYKVYLYFVATESPEINIDRVKIRKAKGKHGVPVNLIEERYYRSLDRLHAAAQLTYQSYFFDNSTTEPKLFAHFKVVRGKKVWDEMDVSALPGWFVEYYVNKIRK